MRETIERCLIEQQLDYFALPLSARLLLVTDGTVTELLEALLKEPITLGHKEQNIASEKSPDQQLRCITLQGKHSQQHWLYAESIIYTENINPQALELLKGNTAIGRVLTQVYPDNHRVITTCGIIKNQNAAKHLSVDKDYLFTYRRYNIFANQTVLITITEWFPIDKIEKQICDS